MKASKIIIICLISIFLISTLQFELSNFDPEGPVLITRVAPEINTIDLETCYEDEEYFVTYNATDPDSIGNLTWSIQTNCSFLEIDEDTGVLSGLPTNSDVGIYWVKVTVRDNQSNQDHRYFNLTVKNVNDDPEILSQDILLAVEDDPYYKDYKVDDIDPTNDKMIWEVHTNASFLKIDKDTGELTGTPTNDDVGWYWVNVTVSDGNGGEDYRAFELTVFNVNDKPKVGKIRPLIVIEEDGADTSIDLNEWFTDEDGDELNFSVDGDDMVQVVISDNGSVTIQPREHWSGEDNITFKAKDSEYFAFATIEVQVLPVNDPPEQVEITLESLDLVEGGEQLAQGNATDPDLLFGDTLTYKWYLVGVGEIGEGKWINLSLPEGDHTIMLNVTDSEKAFSTETLEVYVKAKPYVPPPVDDDDDIEPPVEPKDDTTQILLIFLGGFILLLIGVMIIFAVFRKFGAPKPKEPEVVEAEVETDDVFKAKEEAEKAKAAPPKAAPVGNVTSTGKASAMAEGEKDIYGAYDLDPEDHDEIDKIIESAGLGGAPTEEEIAEDMAKCERKDPECEPLKEMDPVEEMPELEVVLPDDEDLQMLDPDEV